MTGDTTANTLQRLRALPKAEVAHADTKVQLLRALAEWPAAAAASP